MLDDFRQQANTSPFYDEEEEPMFEDVPLQTQQQFLGMSPAQRFVVAVMLFMIVLIIGTFALLVTEKVLLPI